MVKAYVLNNNGKIELTLEELQKLLEEAEAEGKRLAGQPSVVYRDTVQTRPVDITPQWGDTPPFTSPFTCETRTKEAAQTSVSTSMSTGKAEG